MVQGSNLIVVGVLIGLVQAGLPSSRDHHHKRVALLNRINPNSGTSTDIGDLDLLDPLSVAPDLEPIVPKREEGTPAVHKALAAPTPSPQRATSNNLRNKHAVVGKSARFKEAEQRSHQSPSDIHKEQRQPQEQEQSRDTSCDKSVDLAHNVSRALPSLQNQPLWNFISPDVLHLGVVVDSPLREVEGSLSPVGHRLSATFPDLRLRELPVFCKLPKPVPTHFQWAEPLEISASSQLAAFPFHVRGTPLQSLRISDMVLVGERQRDLDYKQEVNDWKQRLRKGNYQQIIMDKDRAIQELQHKTGGVTAEYTQLAKLYQEADSEVKVLKSRYQEDQTTLGLQQKLLTAQDAKVAQLQKVRSELLEQAEEQKVTERNRRIKNKQLKKVLELKNHAEDALRKQLKVLHEQLDENRAYSVQAEGQERATLRNVTEQIRASDGEDLELERHVAEMEAGIKAQASDKARLEKENKDLGDENTRLVSQNTQLEQLETEMQSESKALQTEVKDDRGERDRLQTDIDHLEATERQEVPVSVAHSYPAKTVNNTTQSLDASDDTDDKDGDDDEADFF